MTSRTDSHGRQRVRLDGTSWVGIAISALLAIAGAAMSQVIVNTRHDSAVDERQAAMAGLLDERQSTITSKLEETKTLIERENSHTREVLRIQSDTINVRVNQLEQSVREIERIVRPAPTGPYGR